MKCVLDEDDERSVERRNNKTTDNHSPQTNEYARLLQQLEEGEGASRLETFNGAILIQPGAVR